MNDFAAAVGPETIIFPVLNGMRHNRHSDENGSENMAVIGGVCLVAAEIDHQGFASSSSPTFSDLFMAREKTAKPRPD